MERMLNCCSLCTFDGIVVGISSVSLSPAFYGNLTCSSSSVAAIRHITTPLPIRFLLTAMDMHMGKGATVVKTAPRDQLAGSLTQLVHPAQKHSAQYCSMLYCRATRFAGYPASWCERRDFRNVFYAVSGCLSHCGLTGCPHVLHTWHMHSCQSRWAGTCIFPFEI